MKVAPVDAKLLGRDQQRQNSGPGLLAEEAEDGLHPLQLLGIFLFEEGHQLLRRAVDAADDRNPLHGDIRQSLHEVLGPGLDEDADHQHAAQHQQPADQVGNAYRW